MRRKIHRSLRPSSRVLRRTHRPVVSQLEDRALLSTVTWISSSGGDWDTPSNWSTGAVPGPSDDVVINTPGLTVTVSGSDSADSLTSQAAISVNNGSLTLSSASEIGGDLTIYYGMLAGASSLQVSGLLTISSFGTLKGVPGTVVDAYGGVLFTGYQAYPQTLDGCNLNNHATATYDTGSGVSLLDGATFDNLAGATFEDSGGASFGGDGTGAFNNAGSYVKTSPSTSNFAVPFFNTGSVDAQAGSLTLQVGCGALPSDPAGTGRVTGSFTGAAGTTMNLGYEDLAATTSVSGDTVSISGQIRCPFQASGTAYLGQATTTITGPDTSLANIYVLVFSAVAFDTGQTVTTGNLTVDAGSMLTGTDSFVVDGVLAMPGDRGDTRIVNAGAGAMTIDAYGPVDITSGTLDGVTFNNHDAATLAGDSRPSNVLFLDNTVFDNLSGATVVDDGGMFGSSNGNFAPGSGQFNNAGSYTLASPGGQSLWLVPFFNTGSVDAQAGSLTSRSAAVRCPPIPPAPGASPALSPAPPAPP